MTGDTYHEAGLGKARRKVGAALTGLGKAIKR